MQNQIKTLMTDLQNAIISGEMDKGSDRRDAYAYCAGYMTSMMESFILGSSEAEQKRFKEELTMTFLQVDYRNKVRRAASKGE